MELIDCLFLLNTPSTKDGSLVFSMPKSRSAPTESTLRLKWCLTSEWEAILYSPPPKVTQYTARLNPLNQLQRMDGKSSQTESSVTTSTQASMTLSSTSSLDYLEVYRRSSSFAARSSEPVIVCSRDYTTKASKTMLEQ